MPELRWNPLLGTYTMVAANRQSRPHMPEGWCPFCPSGGKVPDGYRVLQYDNDFPVLSLQPDAPNPSSAGTPNPGLYHVAEAYGKCEVVLYSPQHRAKLYELPVEHLTALVELWAQRFAELRKDPKIRYVFIFENKGEEVGVTMPHPHGQIYAYPFVPLKLQIEAENCRKHHQRHGRCLLCDMNRAETDFGKRVVAQNGHFLAYLPHFTDYPWGVFVSSRRHLPSIDAFSGAERRGLAAMLKTLTAAFDRIYNRPFPYMMCMHQTPVNVQGSLPDCETYHHFHIEFYPPLRDSNRIKWYASSEMGAWAAANVAEVEQNAAMLRKIIGEAAADGSQ